MLKNIKDPVKTEGSKMIREFKQFAFKGNVIDMAVGVIIGGAFGKIVTSLVNDLLMPVIGILLGGINLKELKFVITPASGDVPESAILYGSFLQSVVDFLIIAISVFLFVKMFSFRRKKQEVVEAEPPAPTSEELLAEIRDILKESKSK